MSERVLRRSAVLATVGVLAALLAGCTDDAPQALPPESSSATRTPRSPDTPSVDEPSPTEPAAPALPAAAKDDTKAGAQAFAAFYLELINHAAATGDVQPLKEVSRNCLGCDEYISLYQKVYDAGGFFKDPGMQATTYFVRSEGKQYKVMMTVDIPRTRFRLSRNDRVQIGRAAAVSLTLTVEDGIANKVVTALNGVET